MHRSVSKDSQNEANGVERMIKTRTNTFGLNESATPPDCEHSPDPGATAASQQRHKDRNESHLSARNEIIMTDQHSTAQHGCVPPGAACTRVVSVLLLHCCAELS